MKITSNKKRYNNYDIFSNIIIFFRLYHTCLLDYLFCIKNENTEVVEDRYENINELYYKKVQLLSDSQLDNEGVYPFVGIGFSDQTIEGCNALVEVYFTIFRNSKQADCSLNCSVCNSTLSEDWFSCVSNSIISAFDFSLPQNTTSGEKSKYYNLFSFMRDREYTIGATTLKWEKNFTARVYGDIFIGEIETNGEGIQFQTLRIPLKISSYSKNYKDCVSMENCCS